MMGEFTNDREERLVMKETGLSRKDVRRISPDQYRSIADTAYREGRGNFIKGNTGTVAPEDQRESALDKYTKSLKEARATGHGKPVDSGTPPSLNHHNAPLQKNNNSPTKKAKPGSGGGGGGVGGVDSISGNNGDILVNYSGVWAALPNPGTGEWVLVHEGGQPYWKDLTAC